MQNVSNPPPKQQPTAESLRQRGSSKLHTLVFCHTSQSIKQIRNEGHTREFYVRFGLLYEPSESIK